MRREFDEDTGRVRLIKGDGEVLEECVSRFLIYCLLVCLSCLFISVIKWELCLKVRLGRLNVFNNSQLLHFIKNSCAGSNSIVRDIVVTSI